MTKEAKKHAAAKLEQRAGSIAKSADSVADKTRREISG